MEIARLFNGKKYMWDGSSYQQRGEMEEKASAYRERGFEVMHLENDGKYYLFTRREASGVSTE